EELEARLRREPPVKTPIGGLLAIRAVKLFADGTFGNEGAHLLAPYADRPRRVGTTRLGAAEIEAVARGALQRRHQSATPATGDAAVHDTLGAYQAALAGRTDARFRIEHLGLVDEADIPRLGALGVLAVSHGWLASRRNAEELGPARAERLWDLPALAKV